MRIPRLYLSTPLAVGMTVCLKGAAFNHTVRVLRLKPGAKLILFNGAGGEFRALLNRVEKHTATAYVEVFDPREAESSLQISLAQGLSRSERMDFTLQKAVELGVTAIIPLFTERSSPPVLEKRLEKRLNHWRSVIAGACEQSGRNRLPTLHPPQALPDWLAEHRSAALNLLLDPNATRGLREIKPPATSVTLLIGPEGGLSPGEITLGEQSGFFAVRLGPRVLRTETAGVATLAALQTLWGDLD